MPDLYDPEEFLRCPECRRSTTVSLTMHLDGDVTIECSACEATGIAHPLNQSARTYGGVDG